jgi:hypothetical protein
MKIIFDFEDGNKREYTINEAFENLLRSGERIIIETCHPRYGEVLIIQQKKCRRKS